MLLLVSPFQQMCKGCVLLSYDMVYVCKQGKHLNFALDLFLVMTIVRFTYQ